VAVGGDEVLFLLGLGDLCEAGGLVAEGEGLCVLVVLVGEG